MFHALVEIPLRDVVNAPQQLERFDHGDVPPKLRALPKDHADGLHVCRRCRQGTKPLMRISPPLGTRMPVSILMVVDLPAPFGPM